MAKGQNILTYREALELQRWLVMHRDEMRKTGFTYPQAANWATDQLGFAVTSSNVKHIATEFECDWHETENELRDRISALEATVAELRNELRRHTADEQATALVA